MIPTKEEQENKIIEIKNNLIPQDEIYSFKLYAKWYAEQVIKHCAEVATLKTYRYKSNGDIYCEDNLGQEISNENMDYYSVDKQSILNVINEL